MWPRLQEGWKNANGPCWARLSGGEQQNIHSSLHTQKCRLVAPTTQEVSKKPELLISLRTLAMAGILLLLVTWLSEVKGVQWNRGSASETWWNCHWRTCNTAETASRAQSVHAHKIKCTQSKHVGHFTLNIQHPEIYQQGLAELIINQSKHRGVSTSDSKWLAKECASRLKMQSFHFRPCE